LNAECAKWQAKWRQAETQNNQRRQRALDREAESLRQKEVEQAQRESQLEGREQTLKRNRGVSKRTNQRKEKKIRELKAELGELHHRLKQFEPLAARWKQESAEKAVELKGAKQRIAAAAASTITAGDLFDAHAHGSKFLARAQLLFALILCSTSAKRAPALFMAFCATMNIKLDKMPKRKVFQRTRLIANRFFDILGFYEMMGIEEAQQLQAGFDASSDMRYGGGKQLAVTVVSNSRTVVVGVSQAATGQAKAEAAAAIASFSRKEKRAKAWLDEVERNPEREEQQADFLMSFNGQSNLVQTAWELVVGGSITDQGAAGAQKVFAEHVTEKRNELGAPPLDFCISFCRRHGGCLETKSFLLGVGQVLGATVSTIIYDIVKGFGRTKNGVAHYALGEFFEGCMPTFIGSRFDEVGKAALRILGMSRKLMAALTLKSKMGEIEKCELNPKLLKHLGSQRIRAALMLAAKIFRDIYRKRRLAIKKLEEKKQGETENTTVFNRDQFAVFEKEKLKLFQDMAKDGKVALDKITFTTDAVFEEKLVTSKGDKKHFDQLDKDIAALSDAQRQLFRDMAKRGAAHAVADIRQRDKAYAKAETGVAPSNFEHSSDRTEGVNGCVSEITRAYRGQLTGAPLQALVKASVGKYCERIPEL
jgi:hypothetical protein